jgi:hypothetical protein
VAADLHMPLTPTLQCLGCFELPSCRKVCMCRADGFNGPVIATSSWLGVSDESSM